MTSAATVLYKSLCALGVYRTNVLRGIYKMDPMQTIAEVNVQPEHYREDRMNAWVTLPTDAHCPLSLCEHLEFKHAFFDFFLCMLN